MSDDRTVSMVADMIFSLTPLQLKELRKVLYEEWGDEGEGAGVGAPLIPPDPSKEGGIEIDLPEDYWETAQ